MQKKASSESGRLIYRRNILTFLQRFHCFTWKWFFFLFTINCCLKTRMSLRELNFCYPCEYICTDFFLFFTQLLFLFFILIFFFFFSWIILHTLVTSYLYSLCLFCLIILFIFSQFFKFLEFILFTKRQHADLD